MVSNIFTVCIARILCDDTDALNGHCIPRVVDICIIWLAIGECGHAFKVSYIVVYIVLYVWCHVKILWSQLTQKVSFLYS